MNSISQAFIRGFIKAAAQNKPSTAQPVQYQPRPSPVQQTSTARQIPNTTPQGLISSPAQARQAIDAGTIRSNQAAPRVLPPSQPRQSAPVAQPAKADRFNPTNFVNPKRTELELPKGLHRAINYQESGGQRDGIVPGSNDNGAALGPLQIHRENWTDAAEYNPALTNGYSYSDVTNGNYAAQVMKSYLNRYGKPDIQSNNPFNLARHWNGGPSGDSWNSTKRYGSGVTNYLQQILSGKLE